MRVLIVDTYYPAFLDRHYAERPRLAAAGYDEQLQSLIERCFGTSDAYSQNLRRLGHDAHEVIVNCESLQLRWAAERGAAGWRRRRRRRCPACVRLAVLRGACATRSSQPRWPNSSRTWSISRTSSSPRELDPFRGEGPWWSGRSRARRPEPELLRRST